MEETIVKDGCIYPFEKHYILIALDHLIDKVEKEINEIKENEEELRKVADPEALIKIHERFLNDLEIVRRRVYMMPEVRE